MYFDILGVPVVTYSVCRFFKPKNTFVDKEKTLLEDKSLRKKGRVK